MLPSLLDVFLCSGVHLTPWESRMLSLVIEVGHELFLRVEELTNAVVGAVVEATGINAADLWFFVKGPPEQDLAPNGVMIKTSGWSQQTDWLQQLERAVTNAISGMGFQPQRVAMCHSVALRSTLFSH